MWTHVIAGADVVAGALTDSTCPAEVLSVALANPSLGQPGGETLLPSSQPSEEDRQLYIQRQTACLRRRRVIASRHRTVTPPPIIQVSRHNAR